MREAFDRAVAERACELVTARRPGRDRQVPAGGGLRGHAGRRGHGRGRPLPLLRRGPHLLAAARDRRGPRWAAPTTRAPSRRRPGSRGCCRTTRTRPRSSSAWPGRSACRSAAAYPAETFWAVRKLLEAAAREQPLVILFEDIHWAEPTFLDADRAPRRQDRGSADPDRRRRTDRPVRRQAGLRRRGGRRHQDGAPPARRRREPHADRAPGRRRRRGRRSARPRLRGRRGQSAVRGGAGADAARGAPRPELSRLPHDPRPAGGPARPARARPSAPWSRPPRSSGGRSAAAPCSSWPAATIGPSSTAS